MEIAATKKYLNIFLLLLILSNCSDTNIDESENQPPSSFEVTVNSVSETLASITWEESVDPEGSTVFYDVFLNSNKLSDNITELNYTFEDLLEDTSYSGEIIASDPEGNTVSSLFTFTTTENQPPSPFNITVTNTDSFFSRIEWTESVDPEGTTITYNIYLDEELLVEGTNSLNNVFPELKGLTSYSGKVEAVDNTGKITTRVFSFTTQIKIYDDDLLLDNQPSVETFGEGGYNQIDGSLRIGSLNINLTDVVDLSPLASISTVNGDISIRNTICTNFIGLENINITNEYAKLTIENNDELLNLNGLNSISQVHEVYIADNDALLNLNGLSSLNSVTNYLWIVFNPNLNSISGIQNLNSVSNTLDISNNDSLSTLGGLENITSVGQLSIIDNDILETLNGLNNLSSCTSSLNIADNDSLQNLSHLTGLTYSASLRITDNPLLNNLTGLENLTNVNHTLEIARNSGLTELNGIQNIVFSDNQANYHALIIWENINITNLNPLSNYTFNRGLIRVNFNTQLTDLCGLTTLITEIDDFINDYNFASNNGYNPSEADILNGNCSI
jgi:hypothetical protein